MTPECGRQWGIAFAHMNRAMEVERGMPHQGQNCDMVMVEESSIYYDFCIRVIGISSTDEYHNHPAYLAMRAALYETYRDLGE